MANFNQLLLPPLTVAVWVLTQCAPMFASASGTGESAVEGLLQRVIPDHASQFSIVLETSPPSTYFAIQPGSRNTVIINASDPVAASSGIYWYMKYVANVSVSWLGDQLQLPSNGSVPPVPPEGIVKKTTYRYRYYMNTCTLGYSTVWWNWTRWEREIDWMALNGINMPLAFEGQEKVMYDMLIEDFGFTDSELSTFMSGPAFLPWYRMGNLFGWGGPLSKGWIEKKMELQKLILARMREFGMTPVLPGFSGFVPPAVRHKYPNATVRDSSGWNGFAKTTQLDPTDQLFKQMSSSFITRQTKLYGSDHLYNIDLYNEMLPPTSDPDYLRNVSLGVYKSLNSVDPKAIWLMQGWQFVDKPLFWQAEQMKALLTPIPSGRLLILDLWSEVVPVWFYTDSYFGTNFIWNMLNNFGGRTGLYGKIQTVATSPANALKANESSGQLVGLGLTPEAIETNPIMYDLMMEQVWRGVEGVQDISTWVTRYATRRYNPTGVPKKIVQAWLLLQKSAYTVPFYDTQPGTSGSIFAASPRLNIFNVPECCAPLSLYYNASDVIEAWKLLLDGAREDQPNGKKPLTDTETFGYDITQVTVQGISNAAISIYHSIVQAYKSGNPQWIKSNASIMYDMITDVDNILATQPLYLTGRWLHNASYWNTTPCKHSPSCESVATPERRTCGFSGITKASCVAAGCCFDGSTNGTEQRCYLPNLCEGQLLQFNARNQITMWGPMESHLHDYAYKLWSGHTKDYYLQRWKLWVQALLDSVEIGASKPLEDSQVGIQIFEMQWNLNVTQTYPAEPSGENATAISQLLLEKYQNLLFE